MYNLILLGAPGSGKGSQALRLKDELKIPHISTGDMLRAAKESGTELGKKAAEYMSKGMLVPDEVVIGLVKDRVSQPDCKNGFLLDGFPRTIAQAEALDAMLAEMSMELTDVVEIAVPDEKIVPRITGRRSCPVCKKPYHVIFTPPKKENICDECNVELIQRSDDTEEAVKERLSVYHKQTAPLIDYYKNKNILKTVDGDQSIDDVYSSILKLLKR